MYKDNLVAALQKAHQAGKCKGRIIVVEDSDNIRGFDGCMKRLQFWQKHRDKQIKCNRVNKIECINHVDKRCGTVLRDLRDAWRGHKLPDGEATGGKKNRLTEVDNQKFQVNYGRQSDQMLRQMLRLQKTTKMQLTR